MALPVVFLVEKGSGGDSGCGCGEPRVVDFPMHIEDNTLVIEIPEYNAQPKFPDAADIAALRVTKGVDKISIQAIYTDPMKTGAAACCHPTFPK